MQKKNLTAKITNGCFIAFISVFTIWNIAAPKQTVSWNENRTLQEAPSLSLSHIVSGNFDDDFETWFSDHFVNRDLWIELKAGVRKAALTIENGGVYFAKGQRLVQRYQSYDEKTLDANIDLINSFSDQQNMKANILIVPTAAWGAESTLPSGAWDLDQKQMLDDIGKKFSSQNFINYTDYTNPSANLYFRTDHHWNEQGSYIGYAAICDKVLHKAPNSFSYEEESDSFEGTMYSRSGAFWVRGDPIYKITPEGTDFSAHISYDDGQKESDSLYSDERLNEKDKYTYYADGNHAEEHITTNVNNGKKALIIKDSYAHILLPYLSSEYSEIEMIDLRYYHSPVSDLLTDKENTDLYFIYSLDNFASDPNLAFLR